ncbi:MAG: hypothetical protein MZV64_00105 [Ignavibacteriales bacterium]|nr:hypothetical protein [Ignavibacteriales bacterium]
MSLRLHGALVGDDNHTHPHRADAGGWFALPCQNSGEAVQEHCRRRRFFSVPPARDV